MSVWASEQVRECESANVCACPCLYVREREREEERERNVCECARKMGIKIWSLSARVSECMRKSV